MRTRTITILVTCATIVGIGAWFGWRWATTPVPPDIPLTGANPAFVELVEGCREEIRREPRSAEAWGKLGMVLVINDYAETGRECLAQAERLDPTDPRWPGLHGTSLMSSTNPRLGIPLLRRALALAQTSEQRAALLFRLALILVEEGELDEADEHLDALASVDRGSQRLYFARGLMSIARQDHAAARSQLQTLVNSPFARKRAHALLASLPDNDKEQARRHLAESAQLPADIPWLDPFLVEMNQYRLTQRTPQDQYWELRQKGQAQQGVELLRKAVAQTPSADVCYLLGTVLFERGEMKEAETILRAAIQYDPKHIRALSYLANALFAQAEKCMREGDQSAAMELFRDTVAIEDRVLAQQSDHGAAHLTRGLALKHLGRRDEAIQALRMAVLCRSELAEVHLALGEALAEAGQLSSALPYLRNAVRLAPPGDTHTQEVLQKWEKVHDGKSGP